MQLFGPLLHLATVADKTKKKQKQSNETHTQTVAVDRWEFLRERPCQGRTLPALYHTHTPRLRSGPQASQSAKLCVVQLLSNRAYGKACYTLTNEVRANSYSLFSFRSFFFHDFGPCWADPSYLGTFSQLSLMFIQSYINVRTKVNVHMAFLIYI